MQEHNKKNRTRDPQETGYIWEEEVFRKSSKGVSLPKYLDWQSSILDAIGQQPKLQWNPSDPKTTMGKEIFECVQSYLPVHLALRLEFYSAVGTAFDFYHGVDGFFLIDKSIVTIDLTCRDKQDAKADIVLSRLQANIRLWRVCKKIADKFLT
jgi:hypothetical protein